jgi:hypothetical protein
VAWRVVVVDDAISAGTAVRASCQELRDAGAVPAAVGTLVTGTLRLPFHVGATIPGQVWPAGDCPLCRNGTPLGRPAA